MKTRNELEASLTEVFGDNQEALQAAVVMLLGVSRRHHLDDVIKVTGYDREQVRGVFKNLKANQIWGKVDGQDTTFPSGNWFGTGAESHYSVLADGLAAAGVLTRSFDADRNSYVFRPVL